MAGLTTTYEPTIAQQAFRTAGGKWTWLVWNPNNKRSYTGWMTSLAVHIIALVVMGLIRYSLPEPESWSQLESAWTEDLLPLDLPLELQDEFIPLTREMSLDPGGRAAEGDGDDNGGMANVPALAGPLSSSLSPHAVASVAWSRGDLLSPAGSVRRSRGKGNGIGDGEGDGQGFFGIPFDLGNRVVYVVDNSLSMNHPHDSAAKTRFKRVQMELVNSIWYMRPSQQFYVIFFNRETAAMPSKTMQYATPQAKEHFLTWVAEMKTTGAPTDPRQAMEIALGFEPDIVYFLTDGEFAKGVDRRLLQIKQPRTAIHTFSIGENLTEGALVDIAKNNQGKYTYIP